MPQNFQLGNTPKGILLILCFLLMLAGAQIYSTIHSISLLFPIKSDIPIAVHREGESIFGWLFDVTQSLVYLLLIYTWYLRIPWSRPLTIGISGIHVIYGFVSAGLMLTGWLIGSSSVDLAKTRYSGVAAFTAANIIVTSLYNVVIAILMLFVISYLRGPEIKEWFVINNVEDKQAGHHDTQN